MKNVLILLALLAMIGVAGAENLLSNGDFTLGTDRPGQPVGNGLDATDWSYWNSSGGWNNREVNANGPYGDTSNYHVAAGAAGGYGAGFYQDVAGSAGTVYILSADAALDAWWQNSGYLKIEFYDGLGTEPANLVGEVESPHFTQAPLYDVGVPWAYYTLEGVAPAGTQVVRAILGTWGQGGTARFDNVVLELGAPKATNPNPADAAVVGSGLTELSWTNPDPNNPADTVTVDVYILESASLLIEDPNLGPDILDTGVVQLADGDAIDTIDLTALPASVGGGSYTLTDDHYYYWAVHCTDPNGGGPVTTPGDIWYFFTGDAAPVPGQPVNQYMWVSQDDSAIPDGDGPSDVLYFQVTATYTDDGKSAIVDANFVNLNWGWDPDGADDILGNEDDERGIEEVSDVHNPATKTVTAVYRTHYDAADPNYTTDLMGYWNIRLEVTDGTGTAVGIAGHHEIWDTCGEAAASDPDDDFDTYFDANSDCIIDLTDFAAFAEAWLNCNANKLACP